MGFDRLKFTKEWTSAVDFPTVETNEAQVRADMQALHDESKEALNKLMDALEDSAAAAKLGAVGAQGEESTIQAELDGLHQGMIQAGALPVGGDANQMLIKSSGENYATRWGSLLDIGAAERSHEHSANDVVSGILPVERGGTGERSLEGLAEAMGMPKVAAGSYAGTGTYGEDNPNSLTFDFVPKVVIIVTGGRALRSTIVFIQGAASAMACVCDTASDNSVCHLTWNGNTVSWYNVSYEHLQYNDSLYTYHYVAIG